MSAHIYINKTDMGSKPYWKKFYNFFGQMQWSQTKILPSQNHCNLIFYTYDILNYDLCGVKSLKFEISKVYTIMLQR